MCKPIICATDHFKIEEAPKFMSKPRTTLFQGREDDKSMDH